jgi:hypothetical protein
MRKGRSRALRQAAGHQQSHPKHRGDSDLQQGWVCSHPNPGAGTLGGDRASRTSVKILGGASLV